MTDNFAVLFVYSCYLVIFLGLLAVGAYICDKLDEREKKKTACHNRQKHAPCIVYDWEKEELKWTGTD